MRFLIVDDDRLASNRLMALLRPYRECDAALHVNQACELFQAAVAREGPCDLTTIDVDMPDTPGIELLRLIRDTERRSRVRRTKIIAVSASNSRSD